MLAELSQPGGSSKNCRRWWATRFALFAIIFTTPGCAQFLITNPSRSATEQLLLSTAADRAIASIPLSDFEGKRVFLEAAYLDGPDSKYVLGALRNALSEAGAKLQSDVNKSEIVVEVRSGALSIDSSESLIGIPKTGLPTPAAGAVEIPELALYKASRQKSIAKFALLAYATDSRDHLFSIGPKIGRAYNRQYKLLGIVQWNLTDVPEKKRQKRKKR